MTSLYGSLGVFGSRWGDMLMRQPRLLYSLTISWACASAADRNKSVKIIQIILNKWYWIKIEIVCYIINSELLYFDTVYFLKTNFPLNLNSQRCEPIQKVETRVMDLLDFPDEADIEEIRTSSCCNNNLLIKMGGCISYYNALMIILN